MATEMYIGRNMGYPIQRSWLLLASWEGTPKFSDPHCRVIPMEWSNSLSMIPEEIGRQLIQDHNAADMLGRWPEAYPIHKHDSWPCSYCQYSRLADFETIGCEEQEQWVRHNETGETRLTADPPDLDNPQIIPLKRKRRRSA
jgi:hypothetical protein